VGTATIVGIRENVATTMLGSWHELELDVQLPDRDPYRATRRVALELSTAPHIKVGAEVPVRVDPRDQFEGLLSSRRCRGPDFVDLHWVEVFSARDCRTRSVWVNNGRARPSVGRAELACRELACRDRLGAVHGPPH